MKIAFKILGLLFILIIFVSLGFISYLRFMLPNVGSPPKLSINQDTALIKRGAYLANSVAVCIDCHSTRDWNKFAGPIIIGTEGKGGELFDETMGLPGKFYSKNITPHNLSSWTDGEIYRLITSGVTKEGKVIFPIMPYPSYNKMVPSDVKAIIAYLRTLPSINIETPESEANFPVNLLIRMKPQVAKPMEINERSSEIEKGKYLLTIAGCGECHTPQEKGEPIKGMYLAGGFAFGLPHGGTVHSANITPDKETGIGNWTSIAFINQFKKYSDPAYLPPVVKNNSFNSIMPWLRYSNMEEGDLKAIFAYLQTVAPVKNKVIKFTPDMALSANLK